MKATEFLSRMQNACAAVIAAEKELTEIDARFGDADHGVTMKRIAGALSGGLKADGTIKARLDNGATEVMMINGGSAVPLWYSLLDGMSQGAPDVPGDDTGELSIAEIKALFARGCSELAALSKAKVGDKTMMDALLPACDAIAVYDGDDAAELFVKAADAARAGAEASKNFVSKFGRARSYGEKTIGTADAGALSMSYFFVGLAKAGE